ncbi:MAG: hypothetical protein IPF59_08685 [Ignavibacteria bacterium]|nr:hypothetical protein [Ignavibacteria bacterium]MBK6420403.1 hypothetical protein [Ignavibacteria bacterium]
MKREGALQPLREVLQEWLVMVAAIVGDGTRPTLESTTEEMTTVPLRSTSTTTASEGWGGFSSFDESMPEEVQQAGMDIRQTV